MQLTERKKTGSVTAYVKPTNYCNIGCRHCYLSEAVRADKTKMSLDTVDSIARFLRAMADGENKQGVHIVWHGGEPLLIDPDWFLAASTRLDSQIDRLSQSIQTSLIPYRREFAPMIHQLMGGVVGSSADFSGLRVLGSGKTDYSSLWMSKVEMARSDGLRIIPGVVPAKQDLFDHGAARMVDWMAARDFDSFNIDRYNQFESHLPGCPSNKDHSGFLIQLIDHTLGRMDRFGWSPAINVLDAAIRGVANGEPGDRWGGRCQSDFVVIEPDGSLNNCPDKSSAEKPYANLSDGFAGFAGSKQRRHWIRLQSVGHRNEFCGTCEYASWCKSGCPITENDPETEGDCSGYKKFLNHIKGLLATKSSADLINAYMSQQVPRVTR